MYPTGTASQSYDLKKGDNIIVTAKNTNRTMAQMLRTTFYKVTRTRHKRSFSKCIKHGRKQRKIK